MAGATALIGAGWGSEGKGVVAAAITPWFRAAVRVGGPNAGHTFYDQFGQKHVMRGVPCAAWIDQTVDLIIGAGAVVDRELLEEEMASLPYRHITVDRGAVVVTELMRRQEEAMVGRIGSTAEGVGMARAEKIYRNANATKLAKDYKWSDAVTISDTVLLLQEHLQMGHEVLLEGTQGSGLSLHHGISPVANEPLHMAWPFCTSADTNAAQLAADAGIAPSSVEHTLLVARSYPIRVGGNSGAMGDEVQWADIPGAPEPELTTVTKRQRRIAMWNDEVFHRAVMLNNPCGMVLTFGDYLDPSISGETDPNRVYASAPVAAMVDHIETFFGVSVIAVGTGGKTYALAEFSPCDHGRFWFGQKHSGERAGRTATVAGRS